MRSGPGSLRNAWMDAAKVNGLIVDKTNNANTNRNVDLNSLSDETLAEIAASGSVGIADDPLKEPSGIDTHGAERSLN